MHTHVYQYSLVYLVFTAEYVRVILLESSHSGQPRESARILIAVKNAKISQAQRELTIRADTMVKHDTVACTNLRARLLAYSSLFWRCIFRDK